MRLAKNILDCVVYGVLFLFCILHITGNFQSYCENTVGIMKLYADGYCTTLVKYPLPFIKW